MQTVNNPDNGKSTSLYLIFLSNGPINFKLGLQGLTAYSTMEAELVAAALTMKEPILCSNIMREMGIGTHFDSVPVYIDNTSTLHIAGNRNLQRESQARSSIVLLYSGMSQGGDDPHSGR
ncbi:unnamed protein product [Sphacelaria rigidula]